MLPQRKYDTLNSSYEIVATISGTTIARINKIIIIDEIIRFDFLFCQENMSKTSLLTERILYMNFPFFASFIVFIIWLSYELSKHKRMDAEIEQSFWKKERQANNTRRQSLDDLEYITIPFDNLPMDILADDEQVADYHNTLRFISESPIVNFTGITNTDLKLQYGAPNIDLLTRYDQNYTTLVRTMQQWASYLYDKGYSKEAKSILEFAISTRSDVSGSYKLLCKIYQEENTPEKIKELYPVAESINSVMKKTIVRILQEAEK